MHSGSAGPGGSSAGGAAAPPALQRRGYSAGARHALPKGRLAPGGGAWIEARQGTGVTLVRNACLMSPAGVKKSYANYTVVNGIGPHAAAGLESTWVRSRGSDRRAGGGGMELDAELVESDDQDASADETSLSLLSLDGRRTLSQPSTASSLRRPHSSSAGTVRPPHSASGARERPGSQIGQRPSSRARDRSRPLGITQPRPRSSVAYSSLDRDSPAPKRPSTSLGTRTLVEPKTKGDAKKVDVIPPRTPLRPVTPCGWMEQQKAQKDFLQFVSAGDSPSPPRPIQKMKGADSKETEAMHSNRIEPAETSVDARPARAPAHMRRESRMPRWKEIIGLRKGDRVRTVHGGGGGATVIPKQEFRSRPVAVVYKPPPIIFTEAATRLKVIKGEPAGKRIWVEKADREAFTGSMSIGMTSRAKTFSNRVTARKAQEDQEFIKALLHEESREEPLNKNAEAWITGINSLMDKRVRLRRLQDTLAKAEERHSHALFEIKTTQNLLQTAADDEKAQITVRLQEAMSQAAESEIEIMETKTKCEFFTISVEELGSLQPAERNETGDLHQWAKLNEQLQHGIFEDAESESLCFVRAQDTLDVTRQGWWVEDQTGSGNQQYDLSQDELRVLADDKRSSDVTDNAERNESRDSKDISTPTSENAMLRRKIELREKLLEKQEEWAKRDRETPLWQRSSDYEERRLADLSQFRTLYTETIDAEHLQAYYEEKRIEKQRARHTRAKDLDCQLWPTLQTTAKPKKKKKTDKNKESEDDEALGGEDGRGERAIASEPEIPTESVQSRDADDAQQQEDQDEGKLETEVPAPTDEEQSKSEDSSSDDSDEEGMAHIQQATPGAAYAMIRRLKYPQESASMMVWQENVAAVEESKKAQVNAYRNMCNYFCCAPVGLAAIQDFIYSKNSDTLSISGSNLGVNQATALAGIIKGVDATGSSPSLIPLMKLRLDLNYARLQHLDCSNNNIGSLGADQLCDCLLVAKVSLKSLNISCNNLGEAGAKALVQLLLMKDSPMQDLKADENHFGDRGAANIVRIVPCLKNLRRMSLQKNQVGLKCAKELRALLGTTQTLEELNLGWNEIRSAAAVEFAAGLKANATLRKLHLQWNSIGDSVPMRAFADALGKCKLTFLDLTKNRIGAPGCAMLADGLEHNSDLVELVLDKNPLTMQGVREVLRASSRNTSRHVSVNRCALCRDPAVQFDPAEPGGSYLLDLKDPYSHRILKNLVRYQMAGAGLFDKATPCILKAAPDDEEGKNLKVDFASESEIVFPEEGFMQFNFLDKQKVKPKDSTMDPLSLEILLKQVNDETLGVAEKLDCMLALVGDNMMSYEQLESLLSRSKQSTESTTNRVNLVCQCYHRIANVDSQATVLNLLTKQERAQAQAQLGQSSLEFFHNNPSGHHKLDLAVPAHRDLAVSLIHLRNEMEELEAAVNKYYDNRGGGKRDLSAIGIVWRNSRLNTSPLTLQQSWKLPYYGILEVDFVDIRKPPEEAEPLSEEELQELILSRWDAKSDLLGLHIISEKSMMQILREVSNTLYFSCKQVARLIGRFDPARSAEIRTEILVICWARIVDYHGLTNVLHLLTPKEQAVVMHRLGPLQTFDEMMAVGFYELNLGVPGERFVFQELVHLGGKEPGESILHLTIDGREAEARPEWLAGGIPESSTITLFFVRSQACLNRVFEKGAFDHSKRAPPESSKSTFMESYLEEFCQEGICSPGGEGWIKPFMYRRVRRKLGDKFSTAEHAFYALDDDDSGSLTRNEVGAGLQQVGIYMNQVELAEFVDQLDEDGGGKIEMDEMIQFWDKFTTEIFI